MRKLFIAVASLFFVYALQAQKNVVATNPVVITGHLVKITKPLKDFTPADKAIPDVIVRDLNGIVGKDEDFEEGESAPNYGNSNNFFKILIYFL